MLISKSDITVAPLNTVVSISTLSPAKLVGKVQFTVPDASTPIVVLTAPADVSSKIVCANVEATWSEPDTVPLGNLSITEPLNIVLPSVSKLIVMVSSPT